MILWADSTLVEVNPPDNLIASNLLHLSTDLMILFTLLWHVQTDPVSSSTNSGRKIYQ